MGTGHRGQDSKALEVVESLSNDQRREYLKSKLPAGKKLIGRAHAVPLRAAGKVAGGTALIATGAGMYHHGNQNRAWR